jgi:DinB superfamily
MNAYRERLLGLLGSDDPFQVLEDTPARLRALLGRLGDAGLDRPFGPGKWNARQVFGHLADVEQGIGFRIRQVVVRADGGAIQPFDQDLWARPYPRLDAGAAVRSFAGLRGWNLEYYRVLEPEDLARIGLHPERGEESVETMIRMLAGHDRNHLAQLERIAASGSA